LCEFGRRLSFHPNVVLKAVFFPRHCSLFLLLSVFFCSSFWSEFAQGWLRRPGWSGKLMACLSPRLSHRPVLHFLIWTLPSCAPYRPCQAHAQAGLPPQMSGFTSYLLLSSHPFLLKPLLGLTSFGHERLPWCTRLLRRVVASSIRVVFCCFSPLVICAALTSSLCGHGYVLLDAMVFAF